MGAECIATPARRKPRVELREGYFSESPPLVSGCRSAPAIESGFIGPVFAGQIAT
jgi:hypothetical protein